MVEYKRTSKVKINIYENFTNKQTKLIIIFTKWAICTAVLKMHSNPRRRKKSHVSRMKFHPSLFMLWFYITKYVFFLPRLSTIFFSQLINLGGRGSDTFLRSQRPSSYLFFSLWISMMICFVHLGAPNIENRFSASLESIDIDSMQSSALFFASFFSVDFFSHFTWFSFYSLEVQHINLHDTKKKWNSIWINWISLLLNHELFFA